MTTLAPTPAADPVSPAGTGLASCLYEGTIGHKRHIDVGHGFSQPIVLAYLDLAELDAAFAAHPLWSTRRPAPVRFRRKDMHGDPSVPLDRAVRRTLAEGLGSAPAGPIRVLTHLRHWAWSFNPISLYFAFDEAGTQVEALLAEVTNTPWHERTAYALPVAGPAAARDVGMRFAKQLHVSPFMDLDLDHVIRFSPPGEERLTVEMDDRRQVEAGPAPPTAEDDLDGARRDIERGDLVFSARMVLQRTPLDRASMTEVLRTHRLPSHRVSAGIHLNALRLWRKGAPFRHHPDRSHR